MKKIIIAMMVLTSCAGPSKNIYETIPLERGDIQKIVTSTGVIEPINQVEVGTQVSGIVETLYVDFNSVVKKGQILAEMDKTNLISDLNSSTALCNQAELEFDYQTINYERNTRLHDKGLISDIDFESSQYQYQTAKLSLEMQRSQVNKSQRNLEYATITSPIDGVILSREVDEGQTVAAGLNTPTLYTLAADLTQMQVVASVDEADIGLVKEGQKVSFTVDAFPDDVFYGSVFQVRLNPHTTANVTIYHVIVNAPNKDLKLKPGLTANISIYASENKDVLIVPLKALRFTPNEEHKINNGKTLWLINNGEAVPLSVELGINDGINTSVEGDGLLPGQEIIIGYMSLDDLIVRQKNAAMADPSMLGI